MRPIRYEHWPEAKVLRRVRLRPEHQPTSKMRHYDSGRMLPPPSELVLCRHDSLWRPTMAETAQMRASYYLFYLDGAGFEMTDFAPQSLDDGLAHAEYEFRIHPDEWEIVGDDAPLKDDIRP